jgi:phosphoserine phosphatase
VTNRDGAIAVHARSRRRAPHVIYADRVRTVPVDEILAAIETAASQQPGGAIAFDGDGTLWAGDIGEDFFTALLARGLRDAAHDDLLREAAAEDLATDGGARKIAERIHLAYLAGHFPEERVCEIMTWAAAGWHRDELDAFSAEVIERIGLRERLHAEALRVIERVRRLGIDVHLVSASPRTIVEAAARTVGIEPAMAIAARERCDHAGVVLCAVEPPIPYGEGKVRRLRERIGRRPLYASFGDNAFDVPMLREAAHRIAIRPKQRLVDRAAEVPGLVVLAQE